MKKKTVLRILGIALLLAAVAMPAEGRDKVRLTFTAGGTGGGWFVMAAGMAKIIEEKAPDLQINVIPGGGTTNQPVVGMKKTELGWGLSPFAVAARRGEDPYKEKYEAIRAIGASFSDNYLHILAAEDTGVKTIPELVKYPKPIRVGPGKVGVGGEWVFKKILAYYHSSYDQIKAKGGKVLFTGYPEMATNLKDRHIDFISINIAPPAAIVQEAALGRKLRILPWPEDLRKTMKEKYGFGLGAIKKESYPGILTEDIPTVVYGTVLMVHKDVPADVVYEITKIINENHARLPAIHKSMGVYDPATAWKDLPVPLHPGAEKYYREKGYLK
jgi:TRAP transporter TAXI family solute receptor